MERLDELCLGAGLEVGEEPGCQEEEELRLPPRPPTGSVLVATETWEEEERWRRLFPQIRLCSVVLVRPRPEQLVAWRGVERRRSQRVRSRDLKSSWDWMEPLEPENGGGGNSGFVKRVEVKVHGGNAPEDGDRKPQSTLRLTHSGSAHLSSEPQGDHNYCRGFDTPEGGSQSQEARPLSSEGSEGGYCSPSEKKNVPSMVLRKVTTDHWVLRSGIVKKEEEDDDDEEESPKMRTKKKTEEAPPRSRQKRRKGCGSCAGCLRKNCGTCTYCRDMRKFGGLSRLKQKCVKRRCLVVVNKRPGFQPLDWAGDEPEPPHQDRSGEDTDSADDLPELDHWRWEPERVAAGRMEVKLMSRGGGIMLRNQKKKRRKGAGEAEEARKRRWMKKRRKWSQNNAAKRSKVRREWESLLLKKEKEEEETPSSLVRPVGAALERLQDVHHRRLGPQLPGSSGPPGPAGAAGPTGPLTGTHLQWNLTLDGGQLSDSALTCLSGLLPQEGSILHLSTGLTFIPPPPPPPPAPSPPPPPDVQLVEPKEEEEPISIQLYGRGREQERAEPEVRTGASAAGKYYEVEMEVELPAPDSAQNALTSPSPPPPPSDITEAACDITYSRPEFISLNPEGLSLLGGGARDAAPGGRSLIRLLKMLRRTVLPAHWVAVLADGPELQLLQCSRLSAMRDTIVHVQSDRSFQVSVQTRLLPDSHRVYKEHAHRVAHLSQLVSLLLDLERLSVCRGSRVQPRPRSACCHLLVAPPFHTCLPCLLEEESEEDEESGGEDGSLMEEF